MDKEFKHYMKFEKKGRFIHAEGWAFIEGLIAQEHRIYLVFESEEHTYIIPTIKKRRHELANIFGTEYVGGGFVVSFRKKILPEDDYRVGILIGKDQEIKGFKLTKMDLSI